MEKLERKVNFGEDFDLIYERNVVDIAVRWSVLLQVFYKTVRDIRPGEEMLLYARDALYPEMELESMHKVDEGMEY